MRSVCQLVFRDPSDILLSCALYDNPCLVKNFCTHPTLAVNVGGSSMDIALDEDHCFCNALLRTVCRLLKEDEPRLIRTRKAL